LAKSVHNPFEDSVKVPFLSTTGFSIGPHHNAGESLNIAPVIPFRLNAEWDLIAEPSLSVTYVPSPHEQFGPQDLQTSLFLTPHNANEWLWGLGPIFQFPTATTTRFSIYEQDCAVTIFPIHAAPEPANSRARTSGNGN